MNKDVELKIRTLIRTCIKFIVSQYEDITGVKNENKDVRTCKDVSYTPYVGESSFSLHVHVC